MQNQNNVITFFERKQKEIQMKIRRKELIKQRMDHILAAREIRLKIEKIEAEIIKFEKKIRYR